MWTIDEWIGFVVFKDRDVAATLGALVHKDKRVWGGHSPSLSSLFFVEQSYANFGWASKLMKTLPTLEPPWISISQLLQSLYFCAIFFKHLLLVSSFPMAQATANLKLE